MPAILPFDKSELIQSWPLPEHPLAVVIFGAGSIVRDAHLSAYQLANIPVAGIFDPDTEKAHKLCTAWNIPQITSQENALNQASVCFDLATPPAEHAAILEKIPQGSPVLIQKPMGVHLQDASSILRICRGTEGAAYVKLGVNLDYPQGEPDELWIYPSGTDHWIQVDLKGSWFPQAFAGRMANLQRFANGEDTELISSVEDAWHTMALVEAAFSSSSGGSTPIADFDVVFD